jgi:hypothetical protein
LTADAFEQLSAMTRASGIEAARRALLHDDDTAEDNYREAIERLGHTRFADRLPGCCELVSGAIGS